MSFKDEVAAAFDCSVGMCIDTMRHFHIFGTIDDLLTVVDGNNTLVMVFHAPYRCRLKAVTIRAGVLEYSGGSLNLAKVENGTAIPYTGGEGGDGILVGNVVTPVVPTSATLTADTDYHCEVITADGIDYLNEGDILVMLAFQIDNMTGLMYSLKLERLN